MVVISYAGKEANAKIVYYGPGLGGKTSNLEFIYDSVPSSSRGKMVSMKTQTDRTLFFDFLPLDLGELGGFRTRFLLYTVPGQVFYNATRKLVLRGADAIAFIADSQVGKMDENKESLANLEENLAEYDLSLDSIPWVIQYNKRDLPEVYSIEELNKELNPRNVPYFEGIATEGVGVFETFRGLSKLLLEKLSEEIGQRLVIAKHAGPKTEDQRAKAVEKLLTGPATHRAEPPQAESIAQPAEAPEPVEEVIEMPAATSEPLEEVEELAPGMIETDESMRLLDREEASDKYAHDVAYPEAEPEPEPEETVLEELDLTPEAPPAPYARTEETVDMRERLDLTAGESHESSLERPDVELLRDHEEVPNFFTRSLDSARLELERDTAHFADVHEHKPRWTGPEPEAEARFEPRAAQPPLKPEPAPWPEPAPRTEPAPRPEPAPWCEPAPKPQGIVWPESVARTAPAMRPEPPRAEAQSVKVEEPTDEELSFLHIIRRNNVGVFEKTAARRAAAVSPRPMPAPEAPTEKRSIEGSIEIPLPLGPGEKMQEVTLTIRIRLKPVPQTGRAAEQDFILDGISR